MGKLAQIAAIIQSLMKFVPTALVPDIIALVRAAIPLPTKRENLNEWLTGLTISGPLGNVVRSLGEAWLPSSDATTPSPTPSPEPVLACPGPCPCKEPCPSDDDIWEAITDVEGNVAPVVCGMNTEAMAEWIALAKLLWEVGEPVIEQLIIWIKSLQAAKE